MAGMTKCKDCGHDVSKKAETCPNCGAPLKKKNDIGCLGTIAVLFLVGSIIVLLQDMSGSGSGSSSSYTPTTTPSDGKRTYYATGNVNIRRGPGTDHEVVDQLAKGQPWRCYPKTAGEDWVKCAEDEYIYASLLTTTPPPPLEIVSWNWYADPDFGTDGSVIYTVELKNNTSRYIDLVRVEFATYDAADNLITSDYTFVRGLSPGGTGSTKAYATYFGREKTAKIKIGR